MDKGLEGLDNSTKSTGNPSGALMCKCDYLSRNDFVLNGSRK